MHTERKKMKKDISCKHHEETYSMATFLSDEAHGKTKKEIAKK